MVEAGIAHRVSGLHYFHQTCIAAQMKEGDGDFYNYVRMHCLCLVVLLQKSLCHIQVCTPLATDVPCAETKS